MEFGWINVFGAGIVILMWLPLMVWQFGFSSVLKMFLYTKEYV